MKEGFFEIGDRVTLKREARSLRWPKGCSGRVVDRCFGNRRILLVQFDDGSQGPFFHFELEELNSNIQEVEKVVEKVITQDSGGIEQQRGLKRFRCRLVGQVAEVFCIGRWRPVAPARKLPLSLKAFQQARRALELNHVLRPTDKLILLYE